MSEVDAIKVLKRQVAHCLQHNIQTRNSDRSLCIAVWKEFYEVGDTMRLEQLFDIPSWEGIARIRRQFQAEKLYIPTDPKIALERGWRRDDWEQALGYRVAKEVGADLFGTSKMNPNLL